jgi:hypothetical protein
LGVLGVFEEVDLGVLVVDLGVLGVDLGVFEVLGVVLVEDFEADLRVGLGFILTMFNIPLFSSS